MKRFLVAALALAASTLGAQEYPAKPIRVLVPFAPGGAVDTAARVLPYWESTILPELRAGRNVLVAAHGNSLRALAMHLEGLTKEQVLALEIPTGEPILYDIGSDGRLRSKRVL